MSSHLLSTLHAGHDYLSSFLTQLSQNETLRYHTLTSQTHAILETQDATLIALSMTCVIVLLCHDMQLVGACLLHVTCHVIWSCCMCVFVFR